MSGDHLFFDAKASAEAATIAATVEGVTLLGYAAATDLGGAEYRRVASEPGHAGKFSSADGAWWEIESPTLSLRMFGCDASGATDDTQRIRAAFHAGCILGRAFITDGTYLFTEEVHVGSTDANPPAAGVADGFALVGCPRVSFKCATGATEALPLIVTSGAKDVRFEHIDLDMSTATTGTGQLRFLAVESAIVHDITKIRQGSALQGGGSAVSVNEGCSRFHVTKVRVANCGPTSAAVYLFDCHDSYCADIECRAGQETVDLTSSNRNMLIDIRGYDLTGEAIDVGGSSNNSIEKVYVDGCARGISVKTEALGPDPNNPGANDNDFRDIFVKNWRDYGIFFGGGSTPAPGKIAQTLHRNRFSGIRLVTALAGTGSVSAPFGVRLGSGDVPADPTSGLVLRDVEIDQNAGTAIGLSRIRKFAIQNVRANAPRFMESLGLTGFNMDVSGVMRDLWATGDMTVVGMRQLRLENINLSGSATWGKLSLIDCIGVRACTIRIYDAPNDALDLAFTGQSADVDDKDVLIEDFENLNNSKVTAGRWGLRVRIISGASIIEGVRIVNARIRDDQAAPTSGGFYFSNASFDYCRLSGSRTRNVVIGVNWSAGFFGSNSINDDNAIVPVWQQVASDANFTLTPFLSPYATRHTGTLTANRSVVLSTAQGTAVAGRTKFRIERTGGNSGGNWTLNVGTGPLKALASGQWAEFTFDGGAYYVSAAGSL